ncbi:MAG TPA: hypothetical protein VKR06_37180 [Ktedonosporobacter sp.]|nr:hypothetical protein [Ktedonosporobacter sp.]
MKYSLNEFGEQLKEEDLDALLECTAQVQVDISIERLHHYVNDDKTGRPTLVLGQGWLVSLGIPSSATLTPNTPPFTDGEPQMICDLRYAGEAVGAVTFEDAIRALGISAEAKIWTIKKAP